MCIISRLKSNYRRDTEPIHIYSETLLEEHTTHMISRIRFVKDPIKFVCSKIATATSSERARYSMITLFGAHVGLDEFVTTHTHAHTVHPILLIAQYEPPVEEIQFSPIHQRRYGISYCGRHVHACIYICICSNVCAMRLHPQTPTHAGATAHKVCG